MQFGILLVGLMVLVFYQFHKPPLFFHTAELSRAMQSPQAAELHRVESSYAAAFAQKQRLIDQLVTARHGGDAVGESTARVGLAAAEAEVKALRTTAKQLISKAHPRTESKDADYIFITFVRDHFPSGLVGLFLAVIFCAAMSATASALNALGTTTVVDFYKTSVKPEASDRHYLIAAKLFTVLWGVLAMLFAAFASLLDNLIQAVNILGSIFYGPTLGVFLVGFFLPKVRGTAVFTALCIAQLAVILTFAYSSIGFLWYNVIGCGSVVALALLLTAGRVAFSGPTPS